MTLERARIRRWDEERDGDPSEQRLRSMLEERGFRVSRHVYSPGTRFEEHTHGADKIDAVVSGRFRMATPGAEAVLEAGDWMEVPRETPHTAEVVGDDPVVSLDATRA